MIQYYAMPEGGGPTREVTHREAVAINKNSQTGIFWCIHEFNGRRIKPNIYQLNGFALDIDNGGNHELIKQRIRKWLIPSWLIKTGNGYHVYWLFKEPLKISYSEELDLRYKAFVLNCLIPALGGDPRAHDLCRLLRVPGFLHKKDLNNQMMIEVEHGLHDEIRYTPEQIRNHFPNQKQKEQWDKQKAIVSKNIGKVHGDTMFKKLYSLNNKDCLEILSGTAAVKGERYTFNKTSGGWNIVVNGRQTSCWIDRHGKIGSLDNGGPTVWQWLYWLHRDHKIVYQIMKEIFPDVVA